MLIVDTNIVSYIMRDHTLAHLYRGILDDETTAISFATVAELFEGAFRANWGERKVEILRDEIDKYVVIESSTDICQRWAEIRNARKRHPISAQDAWIAATALAHSCPLVTHDAEDFHGITGLKILTAY